MTPEPRERPVYYPPPWHPAWNAFNDGYLAGVIAGIGLGRAQVSAEYADAETFPNETPRTASYDALWWARDGLSRHEWNARQKAEQATRKRDHAEILARYGPPLTPEQIRENAARSWGLTTAAIRRAA